MTRDDIARKVGEGLKIHFKDALAVMQSITDEISNILKAGEWIEIRGFGTFKSVDRKTKPARVIATGERVIVPPRRTAKFIPGIILKQELRKQSDSENIGAG